jgi:prepilin peptidase CpaA
MEKIVVAALPAALVGLVLVAAWSDLRERRIRNSLTVPAFLLALVLRALPGGATVLDGLAGAGLGLLLMLPFFALSAVGGGDTKLVVAVGAFLGPQALLSALAVAAVVGGAMGVWAAYRARVILPAMFSSWSLLKYAATLGRAGERPTLASPGVLSIPYGVAVAVGVSATLFMGGVR